MSIQYKTPYNVPYLIGQFNFSNLYSVARRYDGLTESKLSEIENTIMEYIISLTKEQISEMQQILVLIDEENAKIYQENCKKLKEIQKEVLDLFGASSTVTKYFNKQRMYPSNTWADKTFERAIEKYKRSKEKTVKQKELENLKIEAVEWLILKGKKLNVDFDVNNALDIANQIAFEEETDRKIKESENSAYFIEFSGQNCDDEENVCLGWDGVSRRCSCGNRRVSWVMGDNHTFKNPEIIAEAY